MHYLRSRFVNREKMDSTIFFSVVIPLYNKRNYIERAINSVLKQTYTFFEIIIINDGSTDGSEEVVKSFSDTRVKLYSQNNKGVSNARNSGAKFAKADWLAFLDADDEYMPYFLFEMARFITIYDNNDLALIGSKYFRDNTSQFGLDLKIQDGIYDYFYFFRNQKSPNHTSTTVVNKHKFNKISGFPEGIKHFEDWITWIKLSLSGNFGYINKPLGIYHTIPGSVSKSNWSCDEIYNDALGFYLTITKFCNKSGISNTKAFSVYLFLNEFILNISIILIKLGEKSLALKLLKLYHLKYFEFKRSYPIKYLILHLLIPQKLRITIKNILK